MILAEEKTWPAALLEYLQSQFDMLLAHACRKQEIHDKINDPTIELTPALMMASNPHAEAREQASLKILELLQLTTLRGWHCTRLTEYEVAHITANGMQPPNLPALIKRIEKALEFGMLEDEIAKRLIQQNQADECSRKDRIWFCFFEPKIAEQCGIERFFRCWGGEALYNSHERDPQTGTALRSIGRPCLIEVDER